MKKILYIIGLLLLSYGLAFSQGCEDPEEGEASGIKVFGFLQSQYEYHFEDISSTSDVNEDKNSFQFKRARFGVTGKIEEDFSYYFVMETSPFVSGTGNPYLLDAFITYKKYKWATVSFGSFKQPFGQEVNTACSGLHTINRALISDYFVLPQRDYGVMLLGGDSETKLRYAVALMNGKGIGTKDGNNKKDFVGRVTYQALPFVRIGGSYRLGYPTTDDDERTTYALELQANYGNWLMQGEYIHDEGSLSSGGGGCGATEAITFGEKRSGYYAMLMYMTPWNVQPIFKYESMDPDLDDKLNPVTYNTMTFGVNYFFNDRVRLQVNYGYKAEEKNEKDNDELLVQVQIKF